MKLTLFCRHNDLVTFLLNEVEYLRAQMVHERQRAERAIDTLLTLTLPGAGPVTVPTPQEARAYAAMVSGPGEPEFDKIGALE